ATLSPRRAASCLPARSSMRSTSTCISVARAIASPSPRSSWATITLLLGVRTSSQLVGFAAQSRTDSGATGCFKLFEDRGWNQNSRIQLGQDPDLVDQDQVVDW